MAATTTQLGLVTPTQGDLSGTWGNTVNNGITEYTNIAIAGTLTLTGDGAVTLANTTGNASASNITSSLAGAGTVTAQFAIVKVSGTTTTKEVTGPSYSKTYVVDNASSFAVTFKASGQAGVSVAAAEKCTVYYNGTDYVKVASSVVDGVSTFSAGTTGLTPSTATSGAVTLSGTLAVANGGTGITSFGAGVATFLGTPSSANLAAAVTDETGSGALVFATSPTLVTPTLGVATATSLQGIIGNVTPATGAFTDLSFSGTGTVSGGTANGVAYLNGSKVLTTGSALTFDGNALNITPVSGNATSVLTGVSTSGAFTNYKNATADHYVGANNNSASLFGGIGGANSLVLAAYGNLPIGFGINGSEQMRLTSTGLGIGTSSPLTPLHAVGAIQSQRTGGVAQYARMVNSGGTATFISDNQASGTYTGFDFQGLSTASGTPVTYATINGSGNLGLGVTPSAWNADYKVQQIGLTSSFYGRVASAQTGIGENFYRDAGGTFRYISSGQVSRLELDSGAFYWYTAGSGTAGNAITFTQAMTLDASGNLGIGNTSPLSRLSVSASTSDGLVANFSRGTSNDPNLPNTYGKPYIRIGGPEYDSNYTDGTYQTIGCGFISGSNVGPAEIGFQITDWSDYGKADIVFATRSSASSNVAPTERARITSGGYFKASFDGTYNSATGQFHEFVGNVANGYTVRTRCANASPANHYIGEFVFSAASPNNTGALFIECRDSTAARFELRSNGGLANYSANDVNLSDRREKTNFAPAKSYLDTICAIPVQTFNYIDQNLEEDAGLTLGVVAQDVQAVAPELVMESNWGTQDEPKMRLSIYQTDLQYALMKALQELKAEFDAYKASHP